jgi:hypothetical protein
MENNTKYKNVWAVQHQQQDVTQGGAHYRHVQRFSLLLQKNKRKDIRNYIPMTIVGLTYNEFKQETG